MSGKPRNTVVTTTSRERIAGAVVTPTINTNTTFLPNDSSIGFNVPAIPTNSIFNGYLITITGVVDPTFVRTFTISPVATGIVILPGLTNLVQYRCEVKTLGYDGADSAATSGVFVTPQKIPAPPTVTAAPLAAGSAVRLTIGAPTDTSALSHYYLSVDVADADGIASPTGTFADLQVVKTATTYDVTGLTNGVQYRFTMWSANSLNTRSYISNSVLLSPIKAPTTFNVATVFGIKGVMTNIPYSELPQAPLKSDGSVVQLSGANITNTTYTELPSDCMYASGGYIYTMSFDVTIDSTPNITDCIIRGFIDSGSTISGFTPINISINKVFDNPTTYTKTITGYPSGTIGSNIYYVQVVAKNRFNESAPKIYQSPVDTRSPSVTPSSSSVYYSYSQGTYSTSWGYPISTITYSTLKTLAAPTASDFYNAAGRVNIRFGGNIVSASASSGRVNNTYSANQFDIPYWKFMRVWYVGTLNNIKYHIIAVCKGDSGFTMYGNPT